MSSSLTFSSPPGIAGMVIAGIAASAGVVNALISRRGSGAAAPPDEALRTAAAAAANAATDTLASRIVSLQTQLEHAESLLDQAYQAGFKPRPVLLTKTAGDE